MTQPARATSATVRCRAIAGAAVIVVVVAVEGGEEDEDVLRDLRFVLEAEFGHCLANPSLFVMAVSTKRRRNAHYLEKRVYQCLFRSASLSLWLRNLASKAPALPL
jgi:hypothetical protein